MGVKAVSDGDAHIDNQCARKGVNECRNQKDRNADAYRYTEYIGERSDRKSVV